MDLLDVLRAKSDDNNNGEILLKDHLYSTIKRAIQLKRFITDNQDVISYNKLKGGLMDEFFRSLYIACLLHDLGKIDLNFQRKLYRDANDQFRRIHNFFKDYDIDINDHEVISILYSLVFINNGEWDKKIRTAILLHHYNDFYVNKDINARYLFDEYPDLNRYLEFMLYKKDEIKLLLKSLLEYIKKRLEKEGGNLTNDINQINQLFQELIDNIDKGYDQIYKLYEALRENHSLTEILKLFKIPDKDFSDDIYDFFVFLGALRRCDYAASANIDIEYPIQVSNVYSGLDTRIRNKIGTTSIGSIWQEELIKKIDDTKRNIVLIAPTGSGKTEFALLWASKRGRKMIYTLPLRVALNDLYWRFSNNYFKSDNNEYLNILHSTSFIEYIKVREEGKEGRYGMVDIEIKHNTAKLFSTPILLTTPDQVFLTSLKYYSSDKLISIYPLSTIVIDEVQAYKPEMVAIILKTIDIIQRLQGDIIIITATFPPYLAEFIKDKFDIIDVSNYDFIKEKVKNYNQKRHLIDLVDNSLFNDNCEIDKKGLEYIMTKLNNNKDKNILIIVNNVKKSIKLYEKLKKKDNDEVYLLHSRLLEKVKSFRISSIRNVKEKNNVKRIILVATQIVEASVDIDFDILITEISPIDSQIQRWGRIYRNRMNNYTSSDPNIIIFKKYDRGTTAIYDKDVIEQTINVLDKNRGKIMAYEDEIAIIKEVYDTKIDNKNNKTLKDIYIEKIKENLEYLKYFTVEKKSHAQRLFREIAGLQIVVPAILSKSDDKIESTFGKLIENNDNNLSWHDIVSKIQEETQSNNVDEWYLKRILYEYSINLPLFLLEKLYKKRNMFEIKEFKGYYTLIIKDEKKKDDIINEIKEYGIDKVLERVDVDTFTSEIEVSENII